VATAARELQEMMTLNAFSKIAKLFPDSSSSWPLADADSVILLPMLFILMLLFGVNSHPRKSRQQLKAIANSFLHFFN
jgi:hypothetical protein